MIPVFFDFDDVKTNTLPLVKEYFATKYGFLFNTYDEMFKGEKHLQDYAHISLRKAMDICDKSSFMKRNLSPPPGAVEGIEAIHELGCPLHTITARSNKTENFVRSYRKKQFDVPFEEPIHFISCPKSFGVYHKQKWEIVKEHGGILVDDQLNHIEPAWENGVEAYLVNTYGFYEGYSDMIETLVDLVPIIKEKHS